MFIEQGLHSIQLLLTQGGWVLWLIAMVALLLIVLTAERIWYLLVTARPRHQQAIADWQLRETMASWCTQRIRDALLSSANRELVASLPVIKLLTLICPMLGLLGTVTGMISVFDLITIHGSGNPKLMASGIAKATIPTMAGMFVAILGLLFSAQIERMITKKHEHLARALSIH